MKPRVDATTLTLVKRGPNGYLYRSPTTLEHWFSHEERVAFARWAALIQVLVARQTTYGRNTRYTAFVVIPEHPALNKVTGSAIAWSLVSRVSASQTRQVSALLLGGGALPSAQRMNNKARLAEHVRWMVKLALATRDWTTWPKVKGLRAPRQVQPKSAPTQQEQLQDKWQRKRKHALAMVTRWERRLASAEGKVKKWSAVAKRAERKLQQLNSGDSAQPTSQGE